MITGWLHCYILLAQWEPWFFEVSNKYSAERYNWPQWDFPVPGIDFGMCSFVHRFVEILERSEVIQIMGRS